MSNGTKVKKRDGRIEPLNLEKMHLMVEEACKDLAGVLLVKLKFNQGFSFMMAFQHKRSRRFLLSLLVILLIWIILTINSLLLDFYFFQ